MSAPQIFQGSPPGHQLCMGQKQTNKQTNKQKTGIGSSAGFLVHEFPLSRGSPILGPPPLSILFGSRLPLTPPPWARCAAGRTSGRARSAASPPGARCPPGTGEARKPPRVWVKEGRGGRPKFFLGWGRSFWHPLKQPQRGCTLKKQRERERVVTSIMLMFPTGESMSILRLNCKTDLWQCHIWIPLKMVVG